jgi:hypothetical protein
MKKRSVILVMVLLALAMPIFAQTPNDFEIWIGLDGDACTIGGYTGSAVKVVIPAVINGIPVVAIGEDAFRDNKNIKEVVIPNKVTSIRHDAFRDCTNLTSIVIPKNVKTIGDNAFTNCTNLSSVILEGEVRISATAFNNCNKLKLNPLSNPASDFEYKSNQARNGVVITKYTGTRTDVVIPATIDGLPVVEIQGGTPPDLGWLNRVNGTFTNGAFENTKITSIVFPNIEIVIGSYAFKGSGLISITLPETVIRIAENAFADCPKIDSQSRDALRTAGYKGSF